MDDNKKVKLTLVRSPIHRIKSHKSCVKGLGLRRLHHTVVVEDTPIKKEKAPTQPKEKKTLKSFFSKKDKPDMKETKVDEFGFDVKESENNQITNVSETRLSCL